MYRQTIEHPQWIPKDWQARLDLRAGHELGRIYRVVPVGAKRRPIPKLDRLDDAALVAALDSPSGPQRDLVQWMLLWRQSAGAIAPLEQLARTSKNALARLHALCTLEGLSPIFNLKSEILLAALTDADPAVRRHAVRLAESRLANSSALADAVAKLADDPDAHVRLQLAYTLGEWNDPRAAEILARLAAKASGDRFLLAAVLSSVTANNVRPIAAAVTAAAERTPPAPALLAGLFRTATATGNSEAIASALRVVVARRGDAYAPWQFRTLANLLDSLDETSTPVAKVAASDAGTLAKDLDAALSAGRAAANDPAAPLDLRAAAVPLLGREKSSHDADLATFRALLAPQSPRELQAAVITAVSRRNDADLARLLLDHWKGLTPDLRSAALDALLSRPARAALLMDAIQAKAIRPTEIDAARRQRLLQSPDRALRARAAELLADVVNADRQKVIDAFAPALTLTGDPKRGQTVFTNTCAICHRLDGVGKAVGPDLASVGDKSPQGLLIAILDPNRAVEARYVNYLATTADGDTHTGLLAAESATSITLLGPDAQQQTLRRQDLTDLRSSNTSLMPEGLEANLKPQDLADLIAFIRAAR
jgi:putative heme-binding domain-containing protein